MASGKPRHEHGIPQGDLVDWGLRGRDVVAGPRSFPHPGQRLHSGNRSPVVVIRGLYGNWQFMLPLITALHQAGHPVHVVTHLQRNCLDVPIAARLVAEHIAAAGLHNAVIVAHSKGTWPRTMCKAPTPKQDKPQTAKFGRRVYP